MFKIGDQVIVKQFDPEDKKIKKTYIGAKRLIKYIGERGFIITINEKGIGVFIPKLLKEVRYILPFMLEDFTIWKKPIEEIPKFYEDILVIFSNNDKIYHFVYGKTIDDFTPKFIEDTRIIAWCNLKDLLKYNPLPWININELNKELNKKT